MLLERLLGDVPPDIPVVLVGPEVGDLPLAVRVVREDPPGSGPLAGLAAGAAVVDTPLVAVLAADMPFALRVVVGALRELVGSDVDAVLPVDSHGQVQPLAAAYRTDRLKRALVALTPVTDRPVRSVLPHLRVMQWPVPGDDLVDVDTAEQLLAARTRAAGEGRDMQAWLDAVSEALGVDVDVDLDVVLDVARDAAHAVERPAAPVTTFLLGAAVARGADPRTAAATISALAARWPEGRA